MAGKRVAAKYGTERLIHLFTDTKSEDEDLYRFIDEAVADIGGTLVRIADGRTLWELFADERMIGNTRADICSRVLKRDLARDWLMSEAGHSPGFCTLYFGIDHSELRRVDAIRDNWRPYTAEFPMTERPHMTKQDMMLACDRAGIDPPRIYAEGFPHNNCGGFCVKAGHAQFAHLLSARPDVFAYHAAQEEAFRARVGKDVAVLRDRRGGFTKPLPMLEFKRQIESGERTVDRRDWGQGCQCFVQPKGEEPECK